MQNVTQTLQLRFLREIVSLIAKLNEILVTRFIKLHVKTYPKITQKCSVQNRRVLTETCKSPHLFVTSDIFKVLTFLLAVIVE